MKKLLVSAVALTMSLAAGYAQDASQWSEGQDITTELGWQNYDFSNGIPGEWTVDAGKMGGDTNNRIPEFYDQSTFGFHQCLYLPKGVYVMHLKGHFRQSWDGREAFVAGTNDTNTKYFADYVTMNEDGTYTTTRTNEASLKNLWSDPSDEMLHSEGTNEDGTYKWGSDGSGEINGKIMWVPVNTTGVRIHYDQGYYDNSIRIAMREDGYVSVGIRRDALADGGSWCAFSDFSMIYQGQATEADLLEFGMEELHQMILDGDSYKTKYTQAGYDGLAGLLDDDLVELDGKTYSSLAEVYNAMDDLTKLYADYDAAFSAAKSIGKVVSASEQLAATTEYDGHDTFLAAIETARNVKNADVYSLESKDDYTNALNNLIAARNQYLLAAPANADGSHDFSPVISNRFFTNEVNNPTWDADNQQWVYSDDIVNNYSGETDKVSAISGDVSLTSADTTALYSWYKYGTTSTHGIGYTPYFDHHMTSAKAWALPTNDITHIEQHITGVPNGYYTLTGMTITWNNDWGTGGNGADCDNHFILAATNESSRTAAGGQHGWWGMEYSEWDKLTTGMVNVTDGNLWVSASVNGFGTVTGFQLTYYGENPDFTTIIAPSIEAVKASAAEKLTFAGDNAKVNAILAEIPAEVTSYDAYADALTKIDEANEYITTASDYLSTWTTIEDYSTLLENYSDGGIEANILNNAFIYALGIGENDIDTYLTAKDAADNYNNYINYLDLLKKCDAYSSESAVSSLVASQTAALQSDYADNAQMTQYLTELTKAYNDAMLASLGIKDATEQNPVEVTVLIANPSFAEGTKGWNGDLTVDSEFQNAERFSCNYDVNQTIIGLPAGTYEVQLTGFYRDGGIGNDESGAYYNWAWIACYDKELWETGNAKLYATSGSQESETSIISIANLQSSEPSFTSYTVATRDEANDEEKADGTIIPAYTYETYNITDSVPSWQFDVKVEDMGETYYFPNSMRGAYWTFAQDKTGAYKNSVRIVVPEGQSLTIGVRKDTLIDGDWTMFDDFRLYYLGYDSETSVNSAAASNASVERVYSVSGVRQNRMNKGINIVKMSDGSVRKIMK